MQRLSNPLPIFLDQRGALLDAGKLYLGTAGADPEVSPITVYWDSACTIEALQPLRTRGGVIVNNGSPAIAYVALADYSIRVRDADGNLVSYTPSVTDIGGGAPTYQPLDTDLTAIAALTTTSFGRALLELANGAALKSAAGIVDGLPLTGGTVSGNIVRSSGGSHVYFADAALTTAKITLTAEGAADPTTAPGEIWFVVA